MWASKLILLVLFIYSTTSSDLLSKFNQNDYKLKDNRIELESYNPAVVKYIKITTFKYNRTTPAFNFSIYFLIDVEDEIEIVAQAYKLASNEYRHFPVRFQVNWLAAFDSNVGGQHSMRKCGNIKTIYFLKDIDYHCCNALTDERKFPPHIPNGRYKINLFFKYNEREVFTVNVFFEVYRPIAIPRN